MAKRLYVGNLPWQFSSSDLEALFGPFGAVHSAEVVSDRETGRSRGFGFVEMETGAEEAISALHETDLKGRNIVVNEARERAAKPRGGGGGYSGGGGGDRGGY